MCKFLAVKAVADSDGDALLAYFPPRCITSLKCTLTPLITLSLRPFQKMIRAAFYLGNREGNCQTARCCPDWCTLCPYFIFSKSCSSESSLLAGSNNGACDSDPISWTSKDETLSPRAKTSLFRGVRQGSVQTLVSCIKPLKLLLLFDRYGSNCIVHVTSVSFDLAAR